MPRIQALLTVKFVAGIAYTVSGSAPIKSPTADFDAAFVFASYPMLARRLLGCGSSNQSLKMSAVSIVGEFSLSITQSEPSRKPWR